MTPGLRWAAAWGILSMISAPLAAQQYGQWSWDARVGLQQRRFDTEIADRSVSGYREAEVRAMLGLNGFVIHPAIAEFRLEIDAAVSRIKQTEQRDHRRIGGGFDLRLVPLSAHPIRLYASVRQFEVNAGRTNDPLTQLATPDFASMWGGRVRFRHGFLAGLLAGFDSSDLTFVERDAGAESHSREFVDWLGGGRGLRHHYRLEHTSRDYGVISYAADDVTATLQEHADLGEHWRWDVSGLGTSRHVTVFNAAGARESRATAARVVSQLVGDLGPRTRFDLVLASGRASSATLSSSSHDLTARWNRRFRVELEITPFVGIGYQQAAGTQVLIPRAGLGTTWHHRFKAADLMTTASGSYGTAATRSGGGERTPPSSFLALGWTSSIGVGAEDTLRAELEVGAARNDLRQSGEAVSEAPDLGASLQGIGTRDSLRARLSLKRRWGSWRMSASSDWARWESPGLSAQPPQESMSMTHTAQLSWRSLQVYANAGTRVGQQATQRQEISYLSASASLRVSRLLTAQVRYKCDTRLVELGPDIDGERIEATVRASLGALTGELQAYQHAERLASTTMRKNRGVVWNLSYRFEGWLPFVSAVQRRGEIR